MKFKPCIDIHNGAVKQLVGGTLRDEGQSAWENYVSDRPAAYFAERFREDRLFGGHIVMLNTPDAPLYEETKEAAIEALSVFPGGFVVGGGMNPETAPFWLANGASAVIVTSYIFHDGAIDESRLRRMVDTVGSDKLILDLSCKQMKDGKYYIATDRWQKISDTVMDKDLLLKLGDSCKEFLVHAVHREGLKKGIDEELIALLASAEGVRTTYAGGVASYDDIRTIARIGEGRVDFTVGSALDLYGGQLSYRKVVAIAAEDGIEK